jgi:glycosyl hydrolase family 123
VQFISPSYKEGMEGWPAFETRPPVKDWRGFDRLVVDILNPSSEPTKLALLISDSKTPFRKGLSYNFQLSILGMRRFIVPLSTFPVGIDRSDIVLIHFYGEKPRDMRLSLDSITLLAPGESVPPIPPALCGTLRKMKAPALREFDRQFAQLSADLHKLAKGEAMRRIADAQLAKIAGQLKAIRDAIGSCSDPEGLNDLQDQLRYLGATCQRACSEMALRVGHKDQGLAENGMLVGFATSMQKILPKDMPFELTVSKEVSLSLARNEKESFQVAVMPREEALRGVTVTVSDLKGPKKAVLAKTQIDCDVMGYVKTEKAPPYDVPYVGWWPDPMLDFLGPVDITQGDLQSFWIRVRAPKGQAPGTYRGTLTVSAEGVKPANYRLNVTVHAFTMPDCTPLPTAITFTPGRVAACTPVDWDTMKYKYADFLADYYIDYDSLYRREGPDFDVLKHLHDQGRLTAFNFGYYGDASSASIDRFRSSYEKSKELGILDHAYIYGFDECRPERFPALEQAATAFKKAFPEVMVMTTSYDYSYGLDTCVKSMDAWCPLTPKFDPEKAAEVRAKGKEVWWYICCGPHHPDANWFVEYGAIEIRLIMGAMTAKYRPDGFLYYELSIWNKNKPITSGPYTDWNPVSWTTYHGDGSIFCVGPKGVPLPTIRLENYRDGLEDYAYTCILEDIVGQYQAKESTLTKKERAWLDKAVKALEVPGLLVAARADYSDDPAVLYAYREQLAELIDASGMADAHPWGTEFGVRGFASK